MIFLVLLFALSVADDITAQKGWWWRNDDAVQGETVWVDTLFNFPFDANVTGFSSNGTIEWQASQDGYAGVAKNTVTATTDQFCMFSVSPNLAAGKEIKVEFDYYIPSGQTGDQLSMLFLTYQPFPFLDRDPDNWVHYDTTLTLAATLFEWRVYFGHLDSFNGLDIGDVWYFDNIRILGKQE